MSSLIPLAILASSLLFKLRSLQAKNIQEKGVSALTILYIHRLAVIPSFIMLLCTFRLEYLHFFAEYPSIIAAIIFSIVIWIVMEYLAFFIVGSAQSLTFLEAFESVVRLPIYLLVGILLNGDYPNLLTGVAVGILVVAMLLKPQQFGKRMKPIFRHGIILILCLALARHGLDAIGNAIYRYILNNIEATLFYMAFFAFLTTGVMNILFFFKKIPQADHQIIAQNKLVAYSQPALWFLASVFSAFAFMYAPIYSVAGIRSVVLALDVISDVRNKRIRLSIRTLAFVVLIGIGVYLIAYSLG